MPASRAGHVGVSPPAEHTHPLPSSTSTSSTSTSSTSSSEDAAFIMHTGAPDSPPGTHDHSPMPLGGTLALRNITTTRPVRASAPSDPATTATIPPDRNAHPTAAPSMHPPVELDCAPRGHTRARSSADAYTASVAASSTVTGGSFQRREDESSALCFSPASPHHQAGSGDRETENDNVAHAPSSSLRSSRASGPIITSIGALSLEQTATSSSVSTGLDKNKAHWSLVDQAEVPMLEVEEGLAASIYELSMEGDPPSLTPRQNDHYDGEDEPEMMLRASAEVRAIVPNDDDVDMRLNTLRVWLLSPLVTAALAAAVFTLDVNTNNGDGRTIKGAVLVQPFTWLLGKLVSSVPYPRHWPYSGFVNHGPFNLKEHTIITLAAGVATGPNLTLRHMAAIAMSNCTHRSGCSTDMWASDMVWPASFVPLLVFSAPLVGIALGGLAARPLVWPGRMVWPEQLQTAAVLTALHKARESHWSRPLVLWITAGISFVYEWVPHLLFSSIAFFEWPVWIAPRKYGVNLVFGGTSGMGLSFLSGDWWTTTSTLGSPLIVPRFARVNMFAGFIIAVCILAPLLVFTNRRDAAHIPFSGMGLFRSDGVLYEKVAVSPPSIVESLRPLPETWDQTHETLPHVPATTVSVFAFSFAASTALLTHAALFYGREVIQWLFYTARDTGAPGGRMPDQHTKLMMHYDPVPDWWYIILLVFAFALAIPMAVVHRTGLPVYGLLLAVLLAAIYIVPVGLMTAITSYEIKITYLSALLSGLLFPRSTAVKLFDLFSCGALEQAMMFVGGLKLGHYFKVPPRINFVVQVGAQLVASAVHWGMWARQARAVRRGTAALVYNGNWGVVAIHAYLGTYWGVIGPKRTLLPLYRWTLWFFLVGALLPIPLWMWARLYPYLWPRRRPASVCIPLVFGAAIDRVQDSPICFTSFFFYGALADLLLHRRRHLNYWIGLNYILSAGLALGTAFVLALTAGIWQTYGEGKAHGYLDRVSKLAARLDGNSLDRYAGGRYLIWRPSKAMTFPPADSL